jgi:hypothetical protein
MEPYIAPLAVSLVNDKPEVENGCPKLQTEQNKPTLSRHLNTLFAGAPDVAGTGFCQGRQ